MTAFVDGAVGRMAPSDQHRLLVDKQIHNHRHDVRIGYAQISTAQTQKKQAAGARFRKQDDADAKMHRKWHRTHSKEGGGCQEQDESADVQTSDNVKLKAHGLNDPQLHRPLQQVSILDDLVEEEASMIVTRRCQLATQDKARTGPDVSYTAV